MIEFNTLVSTISVGGALVCCGFLLGKSYWSNKTMRILIKDGFLKTRQDRDGEIELVKVANNSIIDNSSKE